MTTHGTSPSADDASPGVVVITGAGSGVGRAAALSLSKRGRRLVLVGRRPEPLEETRKMLEADSLVVAADAADPASIERIVDEAVGRFGGVDAYVGCAGAAPLAPIEKTTPALLDEVYRSNTFGPALLIARLWPGMTARRRGVIVLVSSMATADPFPGFFVYAGAKAACNLMVRSCAKEGRRFGVRAFAVAPGAVETAMLRENFTTAQIPERKCLSPEAVADVIAACIAGERDAENGSTIYLPSPT